MSLPKAPEDIAALDLIARAQAKGILPPHEYPPEVIIRHLRDHVEGQDKVITCQDEMLETLRERINGLGTVIQSQIDEIVTLKRALRELHDITVDAMQYGITESQDMLKEWEEQHLKLIEI